MEQFRSGSSGAVETGVLTCRDGSYEPGSHTASFALPIVHLTTVKTKDAKRIVLISL